MLTAATFVCTTLFWIAIILLFVSPLFRLAGAIFEAARLAIYGLTAMAISVFISLGIAMSFNPPLSSVLGMAITHLSVGPGILMQYFGVPFEQLFSMAAWLYTTAAIAVVAAAVGVAQLRPH